MKPGLDDLGDPAVDDRARVDDDVRVARRAAAAALGAGSPDEPDRLGGDEQVLPLGDGQARASRARGTSETPSGSHVPSGPAKCDERQAEQEAHQQAEEQADDRGHELGGRELLDLADRASRPGRPSGTAGSRSRRRSRRRPRPTRRQPAYGDVARTAGADRRPEPSPTRPPSAAPRTRMLRINESLASSRSRRRARARERARAGTVSLASRGTASPRAGPRRTGAARPRSRRARRRRPRRPRCPATPARRPARRARARSPG